MGKNIFFNNYNNLVKNMSNKNVEVDEGQKTRKTVNIPSSMKKTEVDNYESESNVFSLPNVEHFINVLDMIEEDKLEKKIATIEEKVKSGKALTLKELALLKKHNPILYRIALKMMSVRKAFEEQLKNCTSKEEVEAVKLAADIASIGAVKGAKTEEAKMIQEILMKAINEVYEEFKESPEYDMLPLETKEEEENDGLKVV